MAKTVGISTGAAAPLFKNRVHAGLSIAALGHHWTSFIERQKDRDIERYIQERGGVLTDGLERALERHMYKGAL
jgi:hypothetical protein